MNCLETKELVILSGFEGGYGYFGFRCRKDWRLGPGDTQSSTIIVIANTNLIRVLRSLDVLLGKNLDGGRGAKKAKKAKKA